MRDFPVWSFDAITGINWLEVIKALASVVTAVVAFLALKNWQRQDKAKREAEFLDALMEATHTYIAEVSKLVTLLQMAKIGMTSHVPTWESGDEGDKAVKGTIAYIKDHGEQDAKRLEEVLEAVQPSIFELSALAAKGQVFKFDGYAKLQKAVDSLISHFDRMAAFAAVLGSPTWNWEHPAVLKLLKDAMAIDPDEIRRSNKENNLAVLEFAGETYKRIYD
jgi:hypothetical protein